MFEDKYIKYTYDVDEWMGADWDIGIEFTNKVEAISYAKRYKTPARVVRISREYYRGGEDAHNSVDWVDIFFNKHCTEEIKHR